MQTEQIIKERENELLELGFSKYALGYNQFGEIVLSSDLVLDSNEKWQNRIKKMNTRLLFKKRNFIK